MIARSIWPHWLTRYYQISYPFYPRHVHLRSLPALRLVEHIKILQLFCNSTIPLILEHFTSSHRLLVSMAATAVSASTFVGQALGLSGNALTQKVNVGEARVVMRKTSKAAAPASIW